MSEAINPYKFIAVEEYFADYKTWHKLDKVASHVYNADTKTLALNFDRGDGSACSMLLHFVLKDAFRIRFNPTTKTRSAQPIESTQSLLLAPLAFPSQPAPCVWSALAGFESIVLLEKVCQ